MVADKKLLGSLPYLTFQYSASSNLVGLDPHEIGSQDWSVTGSIETFDDGDDADEHWSEDPSTRLGELSQRDGETESIIFEMSGFTVDLQKTDDLRDSLDARSADSTHFMSLASGSLDGLSDELVEFLDLDHQSRLTIIDRVQLAPAWRGLGGVGRLLIGHALNWVAADSQCVATQPHPFFLSDGLERGPEFTKALASVRHTWASLGFVPFREDLYVLHSTLHEEAVAALEEEFLDQ